MPRTNSAVCDAPTQRPIIDTLILIVLMRLIQFAGDLTAGRLDTACGT